MTRIYHYCIYIEKTQMLYDGTIVHEGKPAADMLPKIREAISGDMPDDEKAAFTILSLTRID